MKHSSNFRYLILATAALFTQAPANGVVTFTNDTSISFSNAAFDGEEIVVTNCTLTVDGAHNFANVQILNRGVLTHSFSAGGWLDNTFHVIAEPHVLSDTNPPTLNNPNVLTNTLVVTDGTGSISYTQGVDYAVMEATNAFVQLVRLTNSAIADGGTVLATYDAAGSPVPTGLTLAVTNNVEVELGGSINASGRGYGAGAGPGAGGSRSTNTPYFFVAGGGGGHGGYGGSSATLAAGGNCYDATPAPIDKGSGGGAGSGVGGAGGGAIHLIIGGRLRVDGQVTANGANGINAHSGGGAGGAIWLSAQSVSGSGSISANGGAGEPNDGGGGGGGQIAISCNTNVFAGTLLAHGGSGRVYGGAGTIYSSSSGAPTAQILIDNGGQRGTNTLLSATGPYRLVIGGGAVVNPTNALVRLTSLLVRSNASLAMLANQSALQLTIDENATMETGGGLIADGKGFAGGQGTGAGHSFSFTGGTNGSGGGHGGIGGSAFTNASGGNSYGTVSQPVTFGSGGGGGSGFPHNVGGAGGGQIQLAVNGTLTVDGRISADGIAGVGQGSGGGAGGSVLVTAGTLAGTGLISANGGSGEPPLGGGGGGGRVAVFYTLNQFNGSILARGGPGAHTGGAGTIYTKTNLAVFAQLLIDNGGARGANTPLSLTEAVDLSILGGAVASPSTLGSIRALLIASNSVFSFENPVYPRTLLASNAIIQSGGSLILDGQGSAGNQGLGAGRTTSVPFYGQSGGGGGYGGYGGSSAFAAAGGNSYGSIIAPIDLGSGGGSGNANSNNLGGAGGGALRIIFSGRLAVDGSITADGKPGNGQGSGGGSGGSLWLNVGTLAGAGLLSAKGGPGDLPVGGGGGGGRIALLYETNQFVGTISASGGAGATSGGAGTIYSQKTKGGSIGQLIVDNGGSTGTNTPVILQGPVDLTISGGSQVFYSGVPTLGTVFINSNSWLSFSSPYAPRTLTITGSLSVQASGGILLSGQGSRAEQGIGFGRSLNGTGGGGGYGGFGGRSATNAPGGGSYGSITAPIDLGSGGGNGSQVIFGSASGAGGGALHLIVNGSLTLDGSILADGFNGSLQGSGGGSGGSLWLSAAKLSGAGTISANGGAGDFPNGGGGAGGRVALYVNTNQFTGRISAQGAAGANNGGAGTILTSNRTGGLQIVIDNGGLIGTNTPLTQLGLNSDLFILGGSQVSFNESPPLRNLVIGSNSSLSYAASASRRILTINSNATVAQGGAILLDGQGYPSGQGPGPGATLLSASGYSGGGGANSGYGGSSALGAAGGRPYSPASAPILPGSGGGAGYGLGTNNSGGAGGGALNFTVGGTLQLDGRLSADGRDRIGQWSGGGAGGSLQLTVGNIRGIGRISANGGAGDAPNGGGGGGGCIALYYTSNLFTGDMSARGGPGSTYGGAGTRFLKAVKGNNPVAQVIVDNGGTRGTNTTLSAIDTFDLTISGGAIVEPFNSPAAVVNGVRNLIIRSNSWLTEPPGLAIRLQLNIDGDATLQAGGGININNKGYPGGQGPGAGTVVFSPTFGYLGSGGGHGGFGGISIASASTPNAVGGNSYDLIDQPAQAGSGGGGTSPIIYGTPGGGALAMFVKNNLQIDGQISADGAGTIVEGSGGGSGGTILLSARRIAGLGIISANGGDGDFWQGGGGGGGRIAISAGTNDFAGPLAAHGGQGFMAGGAGTVYLNNTNSLARSLIIDNNGWMGAPTPISSAATRVGLLLSGGSIGYPSIPALLLNTLSVGTGASLTQAASQTNLDVTVLGDAIVGAQASVSAERKGYRGNNGGPGVGQMVSGGSGSGAGYGGAGGASASGMAGGRTYGSAAHPVDLGSRGGLESPSVNTNFCEGGGAIRLRVGGTFTIDGDLSANGSDAFIDRAGGGSGGSLWVTARQLAGSGLITANGGAGEPVEGGGGGGGRVAVYCRSNQFTGSILALGGQGASDGRDGTVIITNIPAPRVIAQTPSGIVSYAVSTVDLTFDTPLNPATISASDVLVDTPNGVLPQSSIGLSEPAVDALRIGFPAQNTLGYYEIQAGPAIEDIYGMPMASVYVGSFVILPPLISGRVTDMYGVGVPYVTLRLTGDPTPSLTDVNGYFSLDVSPGWSGTVTPSKGGSVFIPGSRSYVNVDSDRTNQNFIMVSASALALSSERQGGNLNLRWLGISGVTYQMFASTDLVNWVAYGSPLTGTNGPVSQVVPIDDAPAKFFRFNTSY